MLRLRRVFLKSLYHRASFILEDLMKWVKEKMKARWKERGATKRKRP